MAYKRTKQFLLDNIDSVVLEADKTKKKNTNYE